MKPLRSFVLTAALAACTAASVWAGPVESFLNQPILRNANISFLMVDSDSGDTIVSHRSNHIVPPASVMKVITTATALEMLGPNFRFETTLEAYDSVDGSGTLQGDLYIYGKGDPTLGSTRLGNQNFLYTWIQQLSKLGIKRINGSIIADASFFTDNLNPQWLWEDIGNYYAPGIFSIAYMDNTMNVQCMGGAEGTRAVVISTQPTVDSLVFESQVLCTTRMPQTDVYVRGLPYSNVRYLQGTILPNKGTFGVRGDIPNPPLLLASHLTQRLRQAGIEVTGQPGYTVSRPTGQRRVLYTHRSPTLSAIIRETNQSSNNLYAEQLFHYIGSRAGVPASVQGAVNMVQRFWATRARSLSTAYLCDGSGLAPQDALSALNLVEVLTYMSTQSRYREAWMQSLPVSGKSGTLKSFLNETTLTGRVTAKSGTTSRIKSYAGYIDAPNGHHYTFAILINNPGARVRHVTPLIEQVLLQVAGSQP